VAYIGLPGARLAKSAKTRQLAESINTKAHKIAFSIFFIMPLHIITMVPSIRPKDELTVGPSPQIESLRDALRSNGGETSLPILAGDATVFASETMSPSVGPYDVVVTKFVSIEQYKVATKTEAYKEALELGDKVFTYGFENRSLYIDWGYPALKKVFRFFPKLFVDCETKADPTDYQGKLDNAELYQANGDSGMENYKRKVANSPDHPFYMLSLVVKNISPPGTKAANKYNTEWLKAAFSYDLNVELAGNFVSLDGGPKAFHSVRIDRYPTRETYIQWMESKLFCDLAETRRACTLDKQEQICLAINQK
jgi:hypothetical protein